MIDVTMNKRENGGQQDVGGDSAVIRVVQGVNASHPNFLRPLLDDVM